MFPIKHAAAAKSLQSCLTLCDPIDGSPPGSPVPGILQARILDGLPFPSPMHESEVPQSCLTLCDPMDCSPPGSPVPGIFQARVLEWGAIAFSELSMKILERNKFDIAFGHNQLAFKFSLNFQVARVLKMARVGKCFLHFFNLFCFFCLIHVILVWLTSLGHRSFSGGVQIPLQYVRVSTGTNMVPFSSCTKF